MEREMLTVTVTVPKPKFSIGDIVRIRPGSNRPTGNYDLIGWIKQVSFRGNWWFNPSNETLATVSSLSDTIGPLYEIVIQGGVSGSVGRPQVRMRPGTYLTGFSEDGENDLLELVTDWTLPIVSEDTVDNAGERAEAWAKKLFEESVGVDAYPDEKHAPCPPLGEHWVWDGHTYDWHPYGADHAVSAFIEDTEEEPDGASSIYWRLERQEKFEHTCDGCGRAHDANEDDYEEEHGTAETWEAARDAVQAKAIERGWWRP